MMQSRHAATEAHLQGTPVGSIGMYRQLRDDPSRRLGVSPYGDVFLIIDGWPGFIGRVPPTLP